MDPHAHIPDDVHKLLYEAQDACDVDRDLAKAKIEEAIAINPNIAEAHFMLGNLYCDEFDYEEAKKSYEKACDCGNDFFAAFFNLARILEGHFKDHENAAKNYRQALDIDSKSISVRVNLASIEVSLGNVQGNFTSILKRCTP